jgi:hypothetical protein
MLPQMLVRELLCRTDLAQCSAGASDVSERITSGFPRDPGAKSGRRASPEFTTTERGRSPLEWFLRRPMVVLLMIGVKCSHFRAKPAHISRHLPSRSSERGRRIILGGSSLSCCCSCAYSSGLLPVFLNQDQISHRVLLAIIYQRRR